MVLDELPVEVHNTLVCTVISSYRESLNWEIAAGTAIEYMMDTYLLELSDDELNAIMVDASDQLDTETNRRA